MDRLHCTVVTVMVLFAQAEHKKTAQDLGCLNIGDANKS